MSDTRQEAGKWTGFKVAIEDAIGLASAERNRWELHDDKRTYLHWRDRVVQLQALLLCIDTWEAESAAALATARTEAENERRLRLEFQRRLEGLEIVHRSTLDGRATDRAEGRAEGLREAREALKPFVAYFHELRQADDRNWHPATDGETPGFNPTTDFGRTVDEWLNKGWAALAAPAGEGTTASSQKSDRDEGRIYPCADCGKLRTKAEGGTTFTVCDACWDRHYKTKASEAEKGGEG